MERRCVRRVGTGARGGDDQARPYNYLGLEARGDGRRQQRREGRVRLPCADRSADIRVRMIVLPLGR